MPAPSATAVAQRGTPQGATDPLLLDWTIEALEELDGAVFHIEVELEYAFPTTGNLVTVGGVTLIAPAMMALLAAQQASGRSILPYVVSSFRSREQQAALYQAWISGAPGANMAAPPGQSNHETGTAVDITTSVANAVASYMYRFGWIRDVAGEPWHYHWVG